MPEKRDLSVRMALEWAFMTECAELDLSDGRNELHANVGIEWVVMQRMKVSEYRIDGGGRSDPHYDADLIAAALAAYGRQKGKGGVSVMAANCARNGQTPDWMQGVQPKIEPAAWKRGSRFKRMAETEVLRRGVVEARVPHPRNPQRSIVRRSKVVEEWCPCIWTTSLQEIQSARTNYTSWVNALAEVRDILKRSRDLETINITDHLPRRRPWAA